MRKALVVLSVAWLGCFSDEAPGGDGPDEETTSGDDTTSAATQSVTSAPTSVAESESSSGAIEDCDEGEECLPLPEGWLGPFALAATAGGEPLGCAEPYDTAYAVPLFEDLVEGAIDCGCSCETAGATPPCLADIHKYESEMCSGSPSSSGMGQLPGDCTETASTAVDSVAYVEAASNDPTPPRCTSDRGTPQIEPSSWAIEVVLCGLAAPPSACADGSCVPPWADPFASVCILQAGMHDCPGDFADAHTIYTDLEDQRACDECTCEGVAGDCTPIVYTSTDMFCDALDGGTPACGDTALDTILATTWQPTSAPTCEPAQVVSGEVVGVGAHTLCCRG